MKTTTVPVRECIYLRGTEGGVELHCELGRASACVWCLYLYTSQESGLAFAMGKGDGGEELGV